MDLSSINAIRNVIEKIFGLELSDLSIVGILVFFTMALLLLFGQAFLANIQDFLKGKFKDKTNFSFISVFITGVLIFFFLKLPASLILWILIGSGLLIGRLILGGSGKWVYIILWCALAVLPPGIESYGRHNRDLKNKQLEVYFLLPVNIGIENPQQRTIIRKNLYNVFLSIFKIKDISLSDYFVIYPKTYRDYKTKFAVDEEGDLVLQKKVLAYAMEDRRPVDIVIKGSYRSSGKNSIVVVTVDYQVPDAKYRGLVNTDKKDVILSISDDFEYLSIKLCYEFLDFIRSRSIHADGRVIKIAEFEDPFLKRLLSKYLDFLITQAEVNTRLVEKVEGVLKSKHPLVYEQAGLLLDAYDTSEITTIVDEVAEKNRNAVRKKLEFE